MQALLLNSGQGLRMGDETQKKPKCLLEIQEGETILDRQVRTLLNHSIREILITTGPFAKEMESYLKETFPLATFSYIHNPLYKSTNYIYSMYLARDFIEEDLLLIHGDLVFDPSILGQIIASKDSNTALVNSYQELPKKDFKALIKRGLIQEIGVHLFHEDCSSLQPLYKVSFHLWRAWSLELESFVERGDVKAYGEDALNPILFKHKLSPLYYKEELCQEVDTIEDLESVRASLS